MGAQQDAELAEALRQVVWDLNRRLREDTEPLTRLPVPHQMVLARIERNPGITQAALARAEHVKPQSMSTTLAPLLEHGYVEARADERDARQRCLFATEQGSELIARIRRTRAGWLAQRIDGALDGAEKERLAQAVDLLKRLLDDDGRA